MSIHVFSNVITHPLSAKTGRDTNGFSARSSNMCDYFSFDVSDVTFRSNFYCEVITPPFVHADQIPMGSNLLFSVSSDGDTQRIVVPLSAIAFVFIHFVRGSPRC